jgi:CheY-like chemotaxis protein
MDAAPLRILIVDDNADSAGMLKILFRSAGYEATTALDGTAAIATAHSFRPHVILLDVSLPGMGGIELATALRQIPELRECRLVAVTGHHEDDLPQPSPFDRYFQKPASTDDLLAYLASIEPRPVIPNAPPSV